MQKNVDIYAAVVYSSTVRRKSSENKVYIPDPGIEP